MFTSGKAERRKTECTAHLEMLIFVAFGFGNPNERQARQRKITEQLRAFFASKATKGRATGISFRPHFLIYEFE